MVLSDKESGRRKCLRFYSFYLLYYMYSTALVQLMHISISTGPTAGEALVKRVAVRSNKARVLGGGAL
jgi:hypothetical protein